VEPHWFAIVSWIGLALGFASALAIVVDELLVGHRQRMAVMNVVHPVTALYLGPVWLWAYRRDIAVADAVSHCGAGCTLGDIAGEWLLFAAFASPTLGVAGTYGWEIVVDFILAWTLGVVFQYLASEGGVAHAMKIDTLSIVSFQLGLFGWMALSHFVLFRPPLPVDTAGHWFMMQVGMIVGFLTAWPVNRWLLSSGIKEPMSHSHG
jgi:hypothetical protein